MKKIVVQVYGIKDSVINSGCDKKIKASCGHGCTNCTSKKDQTATMGTAFKEVSAYLNNSAIGDKISLEFIEVNENYRNEQIEDLIERGFNLPITVIDGIVRYYGGISGKLIFNDVKELLS